MKKYGLIESIVMKMIILHNRNLHASLSYRIELACTNDLVTTATTHIRVPWLRTTSFIEIT